MEQDKQVNQVTNQMNNINLNHQGNNHNNGYYNNNYHNNYHGGYNDNYKYGGYNKGYKNQNNYNNYYNKKQNYNRNQKNQHQNNRQQQTYDPYQAQLLLYRAELYICSRYQHLVDINTKNAGVADKLTESSRFFIIKSFSEEDVHKSIKYKVWSSTKLGNQTLSDAYKGCKEAGGEVYLFFSCNGSGRFVGVAKMTSPLDEKNSFLYWTQDQKWQGLFDVEWVYIKDVPFKAFKNLEIKMKDDLVKPVTYSRDCQEIPFPEAKKMMEILERFLNSNTILEHFEYYDLRQENYEKSLQLNSQGGQVPQTQSGTSNK